MQDFKIEVAKSLKEKIEDLSLEEIVGLIEIPPNSEMGDYAFPCFRLAKVFRKAPNMIAADLAESIEAKDAISKVEPAGGYVNFFVNKSQLAKNVINDVLTQGKKYGHSELGKDKTVVIDFSSPNIAKPFHIGHIRTTVIGNALYKIYDSQGYNTVRVNHLGDYGTQFGKLIVAFKKWGNKEAVESNPIPELLKLYIQFHDEAEKHPEMEDEARAWFTKLENDDKEAKDLWQWFRDESLKEFSRVYDLLDIEFDSYAGESFYSDKMDRVIDIIKDKGLLEESEGTNIVNLEEYNMTPALITKKDGSTLYMTRDLAAALYRKENYDFEKCIYVVGSQQSLHFQQLFKVLELIGFEWAKDMVHVPFGMVALEEGTMSTRKGRVVFLESVLRQAIEKTKETMLAKNPNAENVDEIAKQVGVGAVVFQELSNSRIKDYTFSWERTLSFEGETGPYVQYTHARCCSVLRKANMDVTADVDYSVLSDADSSEVLKLIASFNDSILAAMRKNEPHIVTRFVLDLAQAFNKFYHDNPILVDDIEVKKARVALVAATKQTIENALSILGMGAPERM
ncbi:MULTISPECIES: arginine--tRNA ligase [Paraclostridium]|uniref:Arginine--tRNA ligase n=1 Tax=Paraclostridium bifermentans TaxID=1490 RepID=A0A5P3XHF8_PARBF|nr:arginine--tRNA ligase [Paraclostridium bifermentans]MCU9806897.1 arginine--tRNA ligase [Paraclostridium sp. AKS46]MDV8112573.1 arginine--tRNA ligase [Bacillus sp. BAU-SS-2023]EQK48158.1 arginine--tRNA ligase [[Clostridium] bifermentans ATCC 19299] [Paraclostridium bifermentans ATCC 19299]QEZ69756.1 arginine--tRNA ligase [Paraclostridium bifermentans]TQO57230.1 arginine--tRNA ligase [Paraclostridium bifermentans]